MNDIFIEKKASVERCVEQVRSYYAMESGLPFAEDYLRQDAIAMNLQRACEITIDLANLLIRHQKLGLPRDSRDSFALLQRARLVSPDLSRRLQAMIGFRNTLVHQYQELDMRIVVDVIEHRLDDLLEFACVVLAAAGQG
jgi:uncharacterized protein YutE (UPF0331/DUF86 family)